MPAAVTRRSRRNCQVGFRRSVVRRAAPLLQISEEESRDRMREDQCANREGNRSLPPAARGGGRRMARPSSQATHKKAIMIVEYRREDVARPTRLRNAAHGTWCSRRYGAVLMA